MEINILKENETSIVVIEGRVDTVTSPELEAAVKIFLFLPLTESCSHYLFHLIKKQKGLKSSSVMHDFFGVHLHD